MPLRRGSTCQILVDARIELGLVNEMHNLNLGHQASGCAYGRYDPLVEIYVEEMRRRQAGCTAGAGAPVIDTGTAGWNRPIRGCLSVPPDPPAAECCITVIMHGLFGAATERSFGLDGTL